MVVGGQRGAYFEENFSDSEDIYIYTYIYIYTHPEIISGADWGTVIMKCQSFILLFKSNLLQLAT